ncbi:hypothetical protein [Streptomyces sp. 8N706]|uniref:hypothetical protein n=1 Tax=Streptomyces sp. 8N706 TaxID=3457416 RepID=UPI003FCF1136
MAAATTGRGTSLTADGTPPHPSRGPVHPAAPKAPGSELLAVIGPDDSARASLLRALAARPAVGRRPAHVRARGAGAPDPYRRVGDLLAGARRGRRIRGEAMLRTLAAVGLTVTETATGAVPGDLFRHARYEDLGPAEQLLLALALALVHRPAVVLVASADEGLDAAGRRRVWAGLRRVAEAGTPVVAACRSAETAGGYAHRTVLLPHPSGVGGAAYGHR